MIDWKKPIELSTDGGETFVPSYPQFRKQRGYYACVSGYHIRRDGSHAYGDSNVRLRNEVEEKTKSSAFTTSTAVTTRDGLPARILATDSRAFPGRPLLVERQTPGGELTLQAYYPSGRAMQCGPACEDLVVEEPQVSKFYNLYSDGATGKTAHKSLASARDYSKIGKTRVGIIELVTKGEQHLFTKLTPGVLPFTRTA